MLISILNICNILPCLFLLCSQKNKLITNKTLLLLSLLTEISQHPLRTQTDNEKPTQPTLEVSRKHGEKWNARSLIV